jgi:hypothetical protein
VLEPLVGRPIGYAIQELVRLLPAVSRITFAAYRPAPGLDQRLSRDSDPTIDIRKTAERLREEFGIPFWDAILAISMKRGEIPDRYVELAILHDRSPDDYCVDVPHTALKSTTVESLTQELKEGFVLALSSKVHLKDGEVAHIPMMDFRCAPSSKNRTIVKKALKAMGEDAGLLVDSGRSYHFYGVRLLSHDAWLKFLAMAILFTPIVDARYIAHRLADGACRLRVGTGPDKPSMPTVAEIFG